MRNLLPALQAIAWPIALWSGLVSALAASLVPPPGRRRSAAVPDRLKRFALDVVFFAPLYCVGFELLRRADLVTGIAFGAAHALASIGIARRRSAAGPVSESAARRPAHAGRLAASRLLYGALLAFLYPVAPP